MLFYLLFKDVQISVILLAILLYSTSSSLMAYKLLYCSLDEKIGDR